jgi:hypothetical protein
MSELGLPSGRDQTILNTSKVPSALLNRLQDCIVGHKHDVLEIGIGASKGRPDSLAGGFLDALGFWRSFIGAGFVRIPLEVPVGKRIISLEQFYSVNGSAASLTPALRKQSFATGVITDVVAGAADPTGGAGVIESQVLVANHVVLSGFQYFSEVTVTNTNHRVYGCKVRYDALF